MNLESLQTSEHIKEVMTNPNPMVMEATKVYLSGQKLNMGAFGTDFLKVYLEIEMQMYNFLNRVKQREASASKPDILPDEAVNRASEGPKFNI